ncbi:MAG TPA: LuxR C-terminal-related transcriptional regulator [Actinomycetota bacterium]|nr:LuxR C-terminal-related transcriptional regulator [Actinomycetota bacterium]
MTVNADALVAQARDAYARRDWTTARDRFLTARERTGLTVDDVNALADAAWWIGDMDAALEHSEEVYRRCLQGDRPAEAAMSALGIGYLLFLRGDDVAGSGWISRAQRLLRDEPERVEHGYLRYLDVEGGLERHDAPAVLAAATEVQAFGKRFGDPNLVTLGILGEGRGLIRLGRVREGVALLDEAALSLRSDELLPEWAGNLYCHLVAACAELGDVRRASDWTDALTAWCERMSPAAVFTGICRVHRAQLMHLRGGWEMAEEEALRVCRELDGIHAATVAESWYALGEIRRLRGDHDGARAAYERARELGRDPQPGVAMLSVAEGHVSVAAAAIRSALSATTEPLARARLLPAQVEIAIEAGDRSTAAAACDELATVASAFASSGLEASARHARGALTLAEGAPAEALGILLDAIRRWQHVDAPYEVARARVLAARAYAELGDEGSSRAELEAADRGFARLGAGEAGRGRGVPHLTAAAPGGLSEREVEVLRLVASGRTNRDVARTLVISEKTVARHLSNIFAKLGVASRTEAAAYAFERGIVTWNATDRPTG